MHVKLQCFSHNSQEMATLKITIDKRRKYNDGRQPIIFRVTSNRKSTSIDSSIKVLPKEWDSTKGRITKVHPDYKNLNLFLRKRLLELEKGLVEAGLKANKSSIGELKKVLLNEDKTAKITFLDFANKESNID